MSLTLTANRNFSTAAAQTYFPKGVHFSTSPAAAVNKTSALTGITNGKSGLLSVWFKNPNAVGTYRILFTVGARSSGAGQLAAYISGAGALTLIGAKLNNTNVLAMATTTTFVSMSAWAHALFSWNTLTPRRQCYINGNAETLAASTSDTTGDIIYSGSDNNVGNDASTTLPIAGDMSELQFWDNVDIDISNATNRNAFINGGNPIDPATAASVVGSTQRVLLSKTTTSWTTGSAWATNAGLGGGFSITAGSLTAAATNPP